MKLLLVDKRVVYDKIISSKKDDVLHVIFDFFSDDYNSLLSKIIECGTFFSDVALVQHSDMIRGIHMLSKEMRCLSNDVAPYTSFNTLKNFLISLKALVSVQRFDFLGCEIYSPGNMKAIFEYLEAETGIDLRASTNFTGNGPDGDWIMESDNVNVKDTYFTDAIDNWHSILFTYSNLSMYGSNKLIKDISGNVIYLHKDISGYPINPRYDLNGNGIKMPPGNVVTWGNAIYGGNSDGKDLSGVVSIYSTAYAFAALKSNGTVVTWGDTSSGGNSAGIDLTSIVSIYSTDSAFAALKTNGNVVTWGDASYGGNSTGKDLTGVITIYSTNGAFAALKANGTVVTWGDAAYGGNSSPVSSLLTNIVSIYSTYGAFAALQSNGTVVTWGDASYGGDSSSVSSLLTNVVSIYSTYGAFVALKANGNVVTWGNASYGGNSSSVSSLLTNVVSIYSTLRAFAALKSNGTVVTWGDASYGGDSDGKDLSEIVSIYSTGYAFAALKANSNVVTWGDSTYGGDSSLLTDIVSVYSTAYAFAALQSNGNAITWGTNGGDSVGIDLTNIVSIYSTDSAFAALKSNGTVVTWGASFYGGNSTGKDLSGIVSIYSTAFAFAALKPSAHIILTDYYYPTGGSIISDGAINHHSHLSVDYVKFISGGGFCNAEYITTDRYNNLYVTGTVNGYNITIDGSGYAKPSASADVFIVKYNSSGSVHYVKFISSSSNNDSGNSITTDSNNNVYVTGYVTATAGTNITIDGSGYAKPSSNTDAYIVKYNSSGAIQYVKFIGNGLLTTGNAITTDSNNNVYVTGHLYAYAGTSITIDGASYSSPGSYNDTFIVKYNSSGAVQHVKFIGGGGYDVGKSITTDSNNNLYVTGYVGGNAGTTITIDGSGYAKPSDLIDAYIVKYNSSGAIQYVKFIGSSYNDSGNSITTDSNNNVYVTGLVGDAIITIDGSGYAKPSNNNDAYIVKYNSSGAVQYVKFISSSSNNDSGNSITTDGNNNVYVTGYVGGLPGDIITIDGSGYAKPNDVSNCAFIVKYNSSGNVQYVKFIGGSDGGNSITTDSNNNVYVTGSVRGLAGTLITIDGSGYAKPNANDGAYIVKFRQSEPYPFTSNIDISSSIDPVLLSTFIDSINEGITSQNKQSIKNYIIQNRNNIDPGAVDGSKLQGLLTSGTITNKKVFVKPAVSGETVLLDPNLYSKKVNNKTVAIYLMVAPGSNITLQFGVNKYDITITSTGIAYNNILYNVGETIVLGNYKFNLSGLGSVVFDYVDSIDFRLPIELDSSGHIATLNAQGELVTYNAIDFAVQYDASGALSVSQLRETMYYKENASDASKVDVTISGEVIRGLLETGLQSSSLVSFWDDALTGPAAIPLSSISGEGAKYFIDYDNVALNGSVSGTSMDNYLRRHVYNFIVANLNGVGISSTIGAAAVLGDIAISYNNTDANAIADKLVNKLVASDDNGAFIRQSIYEQMLNLDVSRFVGSSGDHATGVSGEGVDNAYRQLPFAVNDSLSFLVTFKFDNMQLGMSNNPFIITPTNPSTANNYVSDSNKITVQDADAMLPLAGPSNITAIFKVKFTQ
jgi:hypothetical protein